MIQLFHKLTTRCYRKIQKTFGFTTLGVLAIVTNRTKDQILLVEHTYAPNWYLPGGKVDHGEDVFAAAKRELLEEVGIICHTPPKLVTMFHNTVQGADNHVAVLMTDHFSEQDANCAEIAEKKWYPINDLPNNLAQSTIYCLNYFRKNTHHE